MPNYDFHTHSTVSDGTYTPAELVAQAAAAGIDVLALTDHDSLLGVAEARSAAAQYGLRLIPGVEISATWHDKGVHIVGLNVDPGCVALQQGLRALQERRVERARQMAERLERHGISGVLEAVRARAGAAMLTRTHFAKHLYDLGLGASVRDAFDRYLARGKPGYVATRWAAMDEAIAWIVAANGAAVIAHPQRYGLSAAGLRRLMGEFREAGGTGLEVVSGTAAPGDVQSNAAYARRFGLFASCGSDFHGPEHGWPKLGRLPSLPAGLVPVWTQWEA